MELRMITTQTTTTTTTRKMCLVGLFALACVANACAQIINEATMRQDIISTITSNNNKQITGVAHRNLMLRLVTFIQGGASGVTSDTSASANYIPFFKTTGSLGSSPFRVGIGTVGLGTAALSNHYLTIGAPNADDPIMSGHIRLGNNGGFGSGIQFDGSATGEGGSVTNYSGLVSLQSEKKAALSGIDSASVSGGKGVFIRSATGPIRLSTGSGNGISRMTIANSGLVGIGTTSPAYGLDVNTTFRSVGATYLGTSGAVGVRTTSPSDNHLMTIGTLSGTTSSYGHNLILGYKEELGSRYSGIMFDGGGSGLFTEVLNIGGSMILASPKKITIGGFSNGDSTAVIGQKGVFIRSTTGPIRFSTVGTGNGTPRMNISNAGNISVGLVSDAYKFNVAGDINTSTFYRIAGAKAAGTSTNWHLLYGKNESERIRLGGSNNTNEYNAFTHVFKDGGTKYADFTFGGTNLYAYGNMASFSESGIVFQDTLGALQNTTLAVRKFQLSTSWPTFGPKVTMDSIGRVGIGNTSPAYKADITGDLRTTTSAYFATSSGSVSIGTTSAGAKLEIATSNAQYPVGFAVQEATHATSRRAVGILGNYQLISDFAADGTRDFAIYNSLAATVPLSIKYGGNVGIGTASPAAGAIVDIVSTTGLVRPSSMTTTQANAIATKPEGGMYYDTTLKKMRFWNGSAYETITSAP